MSKYNSLMKKAELYEKLALYGSRKDFLSAMGQGVSPQGVSPQDDKYLQENHLDTAPPAKPQEVPVTFNEAYKINPEYQNMLNHILDDQIVPLRNDGVLGPQTADALRKFKAKYPGQKIQDVFNRLTSSPPDLEEANKKREEYFRSQSIPPGAPGSRT